MPHDRLYYEIVVLGKNPQEGKWVAAIVLALIFLPGTIGLFL